MSSRPRAASTKSIFVNVSADPNAPPLLQSMTITPTSVRGGTSATGTVFLSSPAPAGGISVTLATSNSSVAHRAGHCQCSRWADVGQFHSHNVRRWKQHIGHHHCILRHHDFSQPDGYRRRSPPPIANTSLRTLPRHLSLSSSPPADARFAPGTNIAFDWSNVTGAVSYTIQIDDQDTFSSPIVNQTVTTSQFSTQHSANPQDVVACAR